MHFKCPRFPIRRTHVFIIPLRAFCRNPLSTTFWGKSIYYDKKERILLYHKCDVEYCFIILFIYLFFKVIFAAPKNRFKSPRPILWGNGLLKIKINNNLFTCERGAEYICIQLFYRKK